MNSDEANLVPLRNQDLAEKAGELLPKATSNPYLQAATSDNTRKAYQQDIRHFVGWGGILPTTPDVILEYLKQHAGISNTRTIVRRLTALKAWHVLQGFTDPTSLPVIRKTLTGIKNIHGKPKVKATALTLEHLTQMVSHLKSSHRLLDCRNNALIQIGFFGAFRRSELVVIKKEHVQFAKEGIEILIPRSKTDQGGEGQVCAIPYGDKNLCPVTALKIWCERANIQSGYIFRRMYKMDHVLYDAIAPQQVNTIVKTILIECGIEDVANFSSHSLRRGFATTASKKGAPLGAIMRQGRWRHEGTVLGYIEEGKMFDNNAVDFILIKK